MFLFLFKASRHATAGYRRHRYVQGTIRGDFDLELLRRCLRGRFKILPHGTHEIQPALARLDLQDELYGHVVSIEDSRDAVWFKLNYDQVGKGETQYVGGWRDLSASDLDDWARDYEALKSQRSLVSQQVSTVRYQLNYVTSFLNPRSPHDIVMRPALDQGLVYSSELKAAMATLQIRVDDLTGQMVEIQTRVKEYLGAQAL